MPGGKTTNRTLAPDLFDFLSRKRRDLSLWMKSQGITSQRALDAFLRSGIWTVDTDTILKMTSLVNPPRPPRVDVAITLPVVAIIEEKEPVAVMVTPPSFEPLDDVNGDEPINEYLKEEIEPTTVLEEKLITTPSTKESNKKKYR